MDEREVPDEDPRGPERQKEKSESRAYLVYSAPNPN
jgi:hypothetical protein